MAAIIQAKKKIGLKYVIMEVVSHHPVWDLFSRRIGRKLKKKKVLDILGPMYVLDTHGKIERAFVYRS